jgi:hypothetical protein
MNRVAAQKIHIEKTLFLGLAASLVLLFGLYIYFVSASVVHVVMRTQTNQEIADISTDISELEGSYIEAQHRVSAEIASLQGYREAKQKIFIDRSEDSLVLSTPVGQ